MAGRNNKFKLLRLLGVGGFSQTYLAQVTSRDLLERCGELIVLKIPFSKRKEQVLIQELIFNASLHFMLQKVVSKHIVKYLGFELFDEKYVMMVEYVDGGSLRDILDDQEYSPELSLDRMIKYIGQICRGLMAVHNCNIIHRDIKPDNILIDNQADTAKLSDFGIARMLIQNQSVRTNIGTCLYMAPEIIDGGGGSIASDIYSLGVTLYEMLTGENPFIRNSVGETVDAIRRGSYEKPSSINPKINAKTEDAILKAMALKPSERFNNAEEFRASIARRPSRNLPTRPQASPSIELIDRAWEHFQADRYSAAEQCLKQYVATHSDDPAGYQALGEFYGKCSRYSEAVCLYKKGIDRIPNSAPLLRGIALVLYKLENYSEAISALEKSQKSGRDPSLQRHDENLLKLLQSKLNS